MPIEIKELQIKVKIAEQAQGGAHTSGVAGGSGSANAGQSEEAKEDIVQECVDKVLQILKDKMDR